MKQNESYIDIVRDRSTATGRTSVFTVNVRGTRSPIGQIRWYWSWRKYAFFPNDNTVFDHGCLRDIANFCESESRRQRTQPARLPDTPEPATTRASDRLHDGDRQQGPAAEAGERGLGSGVSTGAGPNDDLGLTERFI